MALHSESVQTLFNLTLGPDPPACPSELVKDLSFPSDFFIFAVISVVCAVFATTIGVKYNSVKVFNRQIRTQNISNTQWILFYGATSLSSALHAVRFGLPRTTLLYRDSAEILLVLAFLVQGFSALFLAMALNHQRKFRSSGSPPPPPPGTSQASHDLELQRSNWEVIKEWLGGIDALLVALLIIYIVLLYLVIEQPGDPGDSNRLYYGLFLGVFILQRLPCLMLALPTIAQRNSPDAPTPRTKIALGCATVLNLIDFAPLPVWAGITETTPACILKIGGVFDLLYVVYFVGLLAYFMFLRAEYLRNMEECIWVTVSQIQDTFDFRRF